jgi:hypothetical protein
MSSPLDRPGPGGEPNTTGASGAATTRPRLTLRRVTVAG